MKHFLRFLGVLGILLILSSCSSNTVQNQKLSIMEELKQEINSQNITIDKIYHVEIISDGVLVLYKKMNENMLSEAFLRQKDNEWEWGMGYGEITIKSDTDDFLWHGTNDEDTQVFKITGITTNPDIEKIITQKPDGTREKTAKIINTGEGFKIWNVFYEKPINAPVEFTAYDGQGKEILKK
ncbi:hypothetical protein E3U55_17080 [Filobacillus milosensis]|uniref:DUF3862 domain-containing protein n=1 Tax=Filobacillus milosensis TaxID=94137 RepID=A0A4Y8IGN9_9BACI|nr:hypothetical protein [Filobacillus milosensis]TFB12754.1 hypothetical protein E3U55_17080 [Filobacillus milosensis]